MRSVFVILHNEGPHVDSSRVVKYLGGDNIDLVESNILRDTEENHEEAYR
jgi:hypothetical protein